MTDFEEVFQAVAVHQFPSLQAPVELPLDLSRVFQLAWWSSDDSRPAVRVQLPSDDSVAIDWSRSLAEVAQKGSVLEVGIADSAGRWDHLNVLERVSASLGCLPDGSILELAVAGEVPVRARGPVSRGVWRLESFLPAVSPALLARALELSRQSQQDDRLTAASVEVAEAAESTLKLEWSLADDHDPKLQRDGCVLRAICQDGDHTSWHRLFAGRVFMHDPEFRAAFGLEQKLQKLAQEAEESLAAMQTLGAQMAAGFSSLLGITQGELLLAGKRTSFHHSDIRQSKWLRPQEVDSSDDELRQLGFSPLGDLLADAVVMRVYARAQRDCLAVVSATPQGMYLREFFSRCQDGSCLTTSTLPFAEQKPNKKLFKQSLPECDFSGLLQAHRQHLEEQRWQPLDCSPDLRGAAQWMDDYLVAWNS
jgi:hypothetical protein